MRAFYMISRCLSLCVIALLTIAAWPAWGGGGKLLVAIPPGHFTLWLEYRNASGVEQVTLPVDGLRGNAVLDTAPLGAKFSKATLIVLDGSSGNVAAMQAPVKQGATVEMSVSVADFKSVHTLKVRALGADRQPAASGTVTLTDSKGRARTQPILPGRDGAVEFFRVPFGRARVKILFPDGATLAQDVDVKGDHPPSGLVVELAMASASGGAPEGNAPAGKTGSSRPANAPQDQPANVPAGASPTPPSPAPARGTGGAGSLVGLILVAGVAYVAYRAVRQRGTTLADALQRLGLQLPQDDASSSGSTPAAPPAPVVPEGTCPFCGQRKDPVTGSCACSVPAAAPAGAAAAGAGTVRQGSRLLAVQGPALGAAFPLGEPAMSIGRTADNPIALPQDASVSRRHASLIRQGDTYLLRDEGSSNGTFVNGMRVTERVLQPGDEIQVGNTRLRFEVQ